MMRKSSRVAAAAMIGLALLAGSTAQAFSVSTPSLVPDPDAVPGDPNTGGYLYCLVVATSKTAMGITAKIISDTGTDVTEFGYGFRASPGVRVPDLFYAEQTGGSFNDRARYCKATITGARRRDVTVTVTLKAYDKDGNVVATIVAQ
jgi:hypothetical protein